MKRTLSKPWLDAHRFPAEQLDALFQAVLIDDDVDEHTELPDRIDLDHDDALLADCFRICRQLWIEGVDKRELHELLGLLARDNDLGTGDRLRFKHLRAKLKHFRFAHSLYGTRHRYPPVTDWLTTALGHLQDAFKLGQHDRVQQKVRTVRLLVSPLFGAILRRERDRLRLTSSSGFRAYVDREVTKLEGVLRRPTITGAQFHATRKVASRLVSFYDTVRTVRPSEQAYRMSRALAAINGLMGDMHDQLVHRRVMGFQDYEREEFALPIDIRDRIVMLVERFRSSGL